MFSEHIQFMQVPSVDFFSLSIFQNSLREYKIAKTLGWKQNNKKKLRCHKIITE